MATTDMHVYKIWRVNFFFLKYGEWLYTRPPLGTIHPTPYCIVEREDLSLYAHIILGGVY